MSRSCGRWEGGTRGGVQRGACVTAGAAEALGAALIVASGGATTATVEAGGAGGGATTGVDVEL
ncbi:MAG TPA: hypothetical protein VIF09_13435, partial [Polyangiaceae bacterium]